MTSNLDTASDAQESEPAAFGDASSETPPKTHAAGPPQNVPTLTDIVTDVVTEPQVLDAETDVALKKAFAMVLDSSAVHVPTAEPVSTADAAALQRVLTHVDEMLERRLSDALKQMQVAQQATEAAAAAAQPTSATAGAEQAQRVLQRLDVLLERHLTAAVAQATEALARDLKKQLKSDVLLWVGEALEAPAQEDERL